MTECPWCDENYDLTPETEKVHLKTCRIYQSLPVAETTSDGRTFVAVPDYPNILVERESED